MSEHIEQDVEDPTHDQADPEPPTGDNEAAKYRRRLREVEAERDQLKGTLDTMMRGQIEAVLVDKLHRPADFFEVGETVELADLLTDDGQVDTAKVDERLKAIAAERPYLLNKQETSTSGLPPRGPAGDVELTWKEAIT